MASWKPLIHEHKVAPKKTMTSSDEHWKEPFSSLTPLPTQPPPCNLPEGSLLVCNLFPYVLPLIGSLPSALALQVLYVSPLFPCLVTSAPEYGDSMFLWNISIDLQIHMVPNLKTSTKTKFILFNFDLTFRKLLNFLKLWTDCYHFCESCSCYDKFLNLSKRTTLTNNFKTLIWFVRSPFCT
jgi:hypothetical protein